jgi:hypothetical protein
MVAEEIAVMTVVTRNPTTNEKLLLREVAGQRSAEMTVEV